jgi:uncharacterized protein YciI
MGQGFSKGDALAVAASGKATEKLWQWMRNLRYDVLLALAGDTSIAHNAGSSRVGVADATADIDAIDALVNDVKTRYTEHIASIGQEGAHIAADTTNVVSAADASDHPTAVALMTELKTDLEAHDSQSGVHVNNVAITVTASVNQGVFYDLLNEIKVDYEAHRVLTAGGVHGGADNTNAVTAADATTLATAIALANDLRTQYEAHRVMTSGSVHTNPDNTNVITAPVATDLATALALANDLRAMYEAHRILTSGPVHGAADSTNVVTEAATAELADMVTMVNELKVDFNAHNALTMAAAVVTVNP